MREVFYVSHVSQTPNSSVKSLDLGYAGELLQPKRDSAQSSLHCSREGNSTETHWLETGPDRTGGREHYLSTSIGLDRWTTCSYAGRSPHTAGSWGSTQAKNAWDRQGSQNQESRWTRTLIYGQESGKRTKRGWVGEKESYLNHQQMITGKQRDVNKQ